MKVSDVTIDYLTAYIRVDDPDDDTKEQLAMMLKAAKEYVKEYTGLTSGEIDTHEDITIALLVIVADMYDNRNLYLDYKSTAYNRTVELILGMHSTNLL